MQRMGMGGHNHYTLDEIMIFNQGYSYKTKQIARERIEKLKEQNQQEIIIRKQKIKELSKQTNELRKKIKDKSQTLQQDEEERRATILENRKLKQRIATEKFQRIQDKRLAKGKKTAAKNNLKNGMYHVRGHVIEIKDGVRVNSMKQNVANEKMEETPPQYNNSYAPNTYLSNHLSELINTDLSQVKRQGNDLNDFKHNKYSETERNNLNNNKPLISDVMNDLCYDAQLVQRKINDADEVDSDNELCSTDSLEDSGQERTMLKSSLKISRDGLNDSTNRKVTFSDSIEFNDGNVGRLEIKTLERIPLCQRIEVKTNEVVNPVTTNNKNTKQPPYTAEEVLDQLREEALMTKFPEVSSISYPESVSAALEQLSQSKKIEKEMNRGNGDEACEVPLDSNETMSNSLKNYDERLNDFQMERKDPSYVISESVPMDASDVNDRIQYVVSENIPNHSDKQSLHTVNNGKINNEKRSTGYEVTMESKKINHSIPVCSISFIHTSTLPISEHNTIMHRHDNLYQSNNIPIASKSENQPETLSSCLSIGHYTTSVSQINETSANVSKSPQRNDENYDTGSSAVLYVPKYPYFPSKEQRYATNGAYDGRLPMNYYESQYRDNYRNGTPVYNKNSNTTITSVMTLNHATFTSQTSPVTSTNRNNFERDNDTEGSTRELSLSYINITACDISRSDNRSKSNDIYKEVERTLADITFSKTQNNLISEKANHSNDNIQPINNGDIKGLAVKKIVSSQTCNEQKRDVLSNENKISNAIKEGTAIPVRVHTNSTNDVCPIRRGRVIVSADNKKRRQVGNMLPRPPVKPKVNTNMEKSHKIIVPTKNCVSNEEKPLSSTNNKLSDKNEQVKKQYKYLINNHGDSSDDKTVNHKVNPQRIPAKSNYDYFSDQYGDRNGITNVDSQTDFNNNNPKCSLAPSNNLPKSYVRVSPNMLPWAKSPSKNFSQIPLDKTPTDDEINKLWTNVRQCIYNEQTEHAYSDSNYVIDNRYRKQYRRTLSGSSLNRKLDDRPAPRIYTNYTPGGLNRRYGSHDSLNRQIVGDSFSPNVFNKPALLPQRATKVIRNSNSSNENKYTVFKGNDNLSNGHRYQYDTQTGKYGDVTSSMASFLVLEELCKKQSLTPRQADAVFQASNSIQKKLDKEKAGISALSMEERCVMESLERLNEKLKEKGFKAGDPRILSSKPPIPEQRRRLYPNQ